MSENPKSVQHLIYIYIFTTIIITIIIIIIIILLLLIKIIHFALFLVESDCVLNKNSCIL